MSIMNMTLTTIAGTARSAHGPRQHRTHMIAMVLPPLLCGCPSVDGAVRHQFSVRYTCPAEDIRIRERTEIPAHTLLHPAEPPEDVRRDPERLRLWEQRVQETNERADEYHVYDVSGCGLEHRYVCAAALSDPGPVCFDDLSFLQPPAPPP